MRSAREYVACIDGELCNRLKVFHDTEFRSNLLAQFTERSMAVKIEDSLSAFCGFQHIVGMHTDEASKIMSLHSLSPGEVVYSDSRAR